MQSILVGILIAIVQQLLGDKALWAEIFKLVESYAHGLTLSGTPLTGDEKKAAVQKALTSASGDVGAAVARTSGNLVNLAIEAAVAKVNTGR